MQFLTPWPAILGAAIAVPTLLVLYFLKLRRRPVRVSTTMFWTERTRDLQVNVPFKWIRASWTLLLQLAILSLLLLALGRPAIPGGTGAGARTILVIDRSASMSAVDVGDPATSRLEAARRRAVEIIDAASRAGSGSTIGVVTFAARAEVVSSFTREWRGLRQSIGAIEGTDQVADVGAALELVEAMAARAGATDEDAKAAPVDVIVIGDGDYATDEALAVAGARVRFERVGPEPGENGEAAGTNNLGFTAISARRDYDQPGLVRAFARVVNASARAIDTSVLVLADGEPVRRVALHVASGLDADESESSDAGVTLELDLPGAALVSLVIDRPDVLSSDNEAHVAMGAPEVPRVWHVVAGDTEDERSDWILGELLAEIAPGSVRTMGIREYRELEASGEKPDASLIVFDRVSPSVAPPVASITFGAAPALSEIHVLDEPLGATRVLGWRRSDPVLRDVSLDGLYVAQAPVVEVAPDSAEVQTLATGRQGPLIVEVERRGVRHLWISFEPIQSNWPAEPGFVIFMANAVDVLTSRGASITGRAYTTDEAIRVRPAPGAERLVLDGPLRVELALTSGEQPVSVGLLAKAGVYRVEGVTGIEGIVPVNVASERETLARAREAIEIGGQRVGTGDEEDVALREIWPWLVLAAAGLLAIEWFVVAWLNRV